MDDDVEITAGVLTSEQLHHLCTGADALVYGWDDLAVQIQPNGFDLRLESIDRHRGQGTIAVDAAERVLPTLEPIEPDSDGYYDLDSGVYHITYVETVRLPADVMALGRARSSLNRSGVTIHSAVWDAGYHGRSTSLLAVLNSDGFRVQRGARVLQLIFFRLSAPTSNTYRGRYQGENLSPAP